MRYSWFDSTTDYIVTIRKNGGTDAKYEMETWGNPDTNRTAVTKLICRCGGMMVCTTIRRPVFLERG
jgi:hypothetical protein